MKREIKFRAWDENKMIYDGDRIYPSFFTKELKDVCSPVLVSNRAVSFWVHESKLKHSDITYFDHISYLPIKAIMQFTGLKDKNGKEIYEGDIVKTNVNVCTNRKELRQCALNDSFIIPEYKNEDRFCQIDWYNGVRVSGWRLLGKDKRYQAQLKWSTIGNMKIEVVGNIYENPELL